MMDTGASSLLTDEELARRARAGCLASFDELVRRHEAAVHRFVCQRCGNTEDARDITQTAFITAFRKLRQYNSRSSFKTWLFTIARNRAIDHLRARRHHDPDLLKQLEADGNPAETLAGDDDARTLWRTARAGLSDGQFETVWLRYQEDLSAREIARVLHRPEVWVKVTLFRARQKLAALLRDTNTTHPATEPKTTTPTRAMPATAPIVNL